MSVPTERTSAILCPVCHKEIAFVGMNWTAQRYLRKHKNRAGRSCKGARRPIQPGPYSGT